MTFSREINEQYQKAYVFAVRDTQKDKKLGLPANPSVLEEMLDESMVSDIVDIGIIDVPTSMIVGAVHKTEALAQYTQKFLPLCKPDSGYADQWRTLYAVLANKEGFSEEISCVEYLGKFYVLDGLKRVSAVKFFEMPTVRSRVIRVMPVKNDTAEVIQYYNFLRDYQMTRLYQLQFTQNGFFNQLQKALQKQNSYVWNETDRVSFLRYWTKIETAFYKYYGDSLKITAADALVVLTKRYSYAQIIHMDPWVLARVFQAVGRELYALSFPELCKKENSNKGRLYTA